MSNTPETDDELNYNAFGFYTMGGLPTDAVSVEFARNLERERDKYQEQVDTLIIHLGCIQERMFDAERERDKLKRERDLWKENSQSNRDEYYRLSAERDKLEVERDTLKKHTSIMDISHKIANDEYFKLAVENENLECERDNALKNASNNLHQYLKANLRVEEIKSERDLWKLEAERWRDCEKL